MANTLNFGNGKWGVQDGLALAYNDENNNFKPLPFDFTRDSIGTYVDRDGLIKTASNNVPRVDFLDNADGALLLEPARTNYVTYSNGFTDTSWLPTGATVVSGVISPYGTSNAFTVSNTAANGLIQKAVSLTGLRVLSIFAKKGTHRYLYLIGYGGTNNSANFDLENGVVTYMDGNAEIENYGNGWYRCTCFGIDGTTGGVQIFPSNRSVGDATTNGSIEVFGAQLEAGSYPTSYIPTSGSTVTRVGETCGQTPTTGIIGQTEGTVFVDVDFVGVNESITNQIFFIREQASNNGYLFAGFYQGKLNCGLKVGGTTLFDTFFSGVLTKGRYKIAFAYKSGDTKIYVNGVQTGFKNNSFGSTNFAEIFLTGSAGTNQLGDVNRDFKLYNTRLTDAELVILTTI